MRIKTKIRFYDRMQKQSKVEHKNSFGSDISNWLAFTQVMDNIFWLAII